MVIIEHITIGVSRAQSIALMAIYRQHQEQLKHRAIDVGTFPVTLRPHTLVQFGGGLHYQSGGDEIWSCGVRLLTLAGNLPIADSETYMNSVAGPLLTWFKASTSSMNNQASLKFVKVNKIDAAGHYSEPGTPFTHFYAANQMGNAPMTLPFDSCCVFTWESDQAAGPAHRGRIYPPNSFTVSGGKISSDDRTFHANAGKALIGLLGAADAGDTTAVPSIMSNIDQAFRHIFAVSVDDLPDQQRRREAAIASSRTTVSV